MLALVASLAVNILTLSLIATSLWEWRMAAAAWPSRFPTQLAEFSRTLPTEKAGALRAIGQDAEPVSKAARGEAKQVRQELATLFRADQFDKERFTAAQGRLVEEEFKARRAQMRLIADVSDKMSSEERRAFLKWRRENT